MRKRERLRKKVREKVKENLVRKKSELEKVKERVSFCVKSNWWP